ncbi:MAG: aminomethyl-transferring glycine dehydrogenase subunit GcvPA [Sphingomonadaceae bacterium]|uniref:aminomethyl-transferring glycine dehydrogenase subunit GcvPA n=1 Tax=Thermaurantiacus sp. TaxID=2820283 RepID=UPI00298F010C|nr:aminomethyl-transferring glycine dehydrogenase subunit GcvPA [Thermaurantiacus sp.]MCS6986585.1 aminomethyl-transferring glycine dehydrogenase subunit GcvPA [Sphingomonadaceae bacterium]MDW8414154.1 aminomethyl-transferring glycine dehydrogenase subunit GcvPA [Thermaurantiacus sp.]
MRYLPLTDADRRAMLEAIGASSVDDLFVDVPPEARLLGPIPGLPGHRSELSVERELVRLARQNLAAGDHPFFLGCGAYRHHVPASVDHLIQRGEFLTSYTPYQPEIAQGTLQVLFEFQTQVARLFAMEVANASMYDGSTAMTEAIFMARRITRRPKTLVSAGVHPHYVRAALALARFTGDRIEAGVPSPNSTTPGDDLERLAAAIDDETSAVVVQYPDVFGHVADLEPLAAAAHARSALFVVVVTEPVALGLIRPPGDMGADIVVGEGQGLGVGLQFGGPYLGLFATRERFVRQMPGRLCGATHDADGRRGFVLTLATREQHIRREKATSNICTNAGLMSLAFSIHLALLGERGLRQLAALNHAIASRTADRLAAIPGVRLVTPRFFNEFTLELPVPARQAVRDMAAMGVLGGVSAGRLWPERPELAHLLIVAATETVTDADVAALGDALQETLATEYAGA